MPSIFQKQGKKIRDEEMREVTETRKQYILSDVYKWQHYIIGTLEFFWQCFSFSIGRGLSYKDAVFITTME